MGWRTNRAAQSLEDWELSQAQRPASALKQVYSQGLQDVQTRAHLAFDAFFRRLRRGEQAGFPRFKGKGWYDSFSFKQAGCGCKVDGRWRDLEKIGRVQMIARRPISGAIKTLTIRRSSTGTWSACCSVAVEPEPLPQTQRAVGVDVGLEPFARLSTGAQLARPRFLRTDERALATAQRRSSTAEPGTPARRKGRTVVAHSHERMANRRKDFAHQLRRQRGNESGIIGLEGLNSARMVSPPGKQYCRRGVEPTRHLYALQSCQRWSRCSGVVTQEVSIRVHQRPYCGWRSPYWRWSSAAWG